GLGIAVALIALAALLQRRAVSRSTVLPVSDRLAESRDRLEAARDRSRARGGGAFLGFSGGRWVGADPEHSALLLGPPRSGKTTGVVIPSLMACPGAAVSTSTKRDVINATLAARATLGEPWLFDPSGEKSGKSVGARRLCWSPVAG